MIAPLFYFLVPKMLWYGIERKKQFFGKKMIPRHWKEILTVLHKGGYLSEPEPARKLWSLYDGKDKFISSVRAKTVWELFDAGMLLDEESVPSRRNPQGKITKWSRGFFKRYPQLREFDKIRVKEGFLTKSRHPEASVEGDDIVLYPKFWKHEQRTQDFIFLHEIGHWVLDEYGLSEWIKTANSLGIDPWNTLNLPFGQYNMQEAFADSFASYFTDGDVKLRYPNWSELVKIVWRQPIRKNGYKSVIEGTIGITIDGKDYVLRNNPPLDRDYWLPVGLKHRLEILYQKDYGHPDFGGFMDVGAENYNEFGEGRELELGTGVTVYLYMDMYDFQGRDKYPKGLGHTPKYKKQGELHLRLSDPSEVFPECKKDLDAVLDELTQRGIEKFKVYEVAFSNLYHKEYRGEGLGEFIYEGALQLSGILGETVILVGDACSFEFDHDWKDEWGDQSFFYNEDATSPSAERVYVSLQKRYIGKGLIVSSVLKSGSVETRGWYWNKGGK